MPPTTPSTIHLNLFAFACGHHSAAWRAPGWSVDRLGSISYWEELARIAEWGRLDAVFLADGQSAGLGGAGRGPSWFLEPIITLAAVARATDHIGLATTVSSTFWDPFHAARMIASLDHISEGRTGINVVTSMSDDEARNHGLAELPDHDARYARAAEFIATVVQLWDSWPTEAILADPAGAYVDEPQLRVVDHHGEHFDVAGPLNIPQPPQGRPVLFQAGASEPGRELAARYEGVYAVAWDLASAREYRQDLRARAARLGRNPDDLVVMPGLVTYVASTEREARAKQQELNALLPVEDPLRQLSAFVGTDTFRWALDAPVPRLPPLAAFTGPRGRYVTVLRVIESTRPTVRELLGYLAAGGHATFVGTPGQVGRRRDGTVGVDNGAADGFNLMPPTLPAGLEDVVDQVVPVLQRRGRFCREYAGSTLRAHLGE